jgi:protein-S-isoprenylcysteine O-methyltransferase Ste14
MARSRLEKTRRFTSAIVVGLLVAAAMMNQSPDKPDTLEVMEVVGFSLLWVSMLGRIWSGAYLSGRKTKELCNDGPFSMTRNPLYFFSLIGTIGLGLLSNSLIICGAAVAFFLAYYHFVIRDEERRLHEAFGDKFAEYCRRVPRLIPRIRNFHAGSTLTLHTKPFFRTICDSGLIAVAMIIYEVSEDIDPSTWHRFVPVLWRLR